ncbi:MAG TPA: M28 family peptidase [Vicinamibacterales bacterium]|nr:M28 family peptidase [Vicinamibacterales bacterium]
MTRRSALLCLIAALVLCGRLSQTDVAGQRTPQSAKPSSAPFFVQWPLPETGKAYATIDGRHLWQYVREQADIAERYRDQGHSQFWGRIAGTSGDVEDAAWLLEKYRQAGLTDAHIQTVTFFDPQWAPQSWEVTATTMGKALKLSSAQPPYGAVATDGRVLDLPAVYVGLGSEADFAGRDVRGKAVLFIRSQFTYAIGPADVLKRAEDRGAAAILISDLRGGNFNVQAYRATTKLPCFNLGTEDAITLRDLIAASSDDPPHVKIRLDATWESGQKSFLVWGTLPGATDETIYVIAHRDGWFDAAGDNASGVATLLGVAEYFAKVPQSQRRRTMIFVGTDGHHQVNPGGYGREWMAANRERLFARTAVMFNAEHPSEVLTHGGATGGWTETIVPNAWYAGGAARPQLTTIARDAFHEFGLPVWPQPSETPPSGDVGPFVGFLPGVVAQSNDFINMHTTGDTPDNVAWTGLEAAARAYAKIVDDVNKLPLSELRRGPETPYQPRINLAGCQPWIKDSSVECKATSER